LFQRLAKLEQEDEAAKGTENTDVQSQPSKSEDDKTQQTSKTEVDKTQQTSKTEASSSAPGEQVKGDNMDLDNKPAEKSTEQHSEASQKA